ncbi:MAG: TspO/MBR family protein [Calditrichia bacterium]
MKISTVLTFILIMLLAFLPGIIGSQFPADEWYRMLQKPSFNPPSWIFGPVWTFLYILIGISGFLAWENRGSSKTAFWVFGLQLLLNGLWSYVFFGLHLIWGAFLVIILLLISIIVNGLLFYRIKKSAGYLFIPYLLWVMFATALNLSIGLLNS